MRNKYELENARSSTERANSDFLLTPEQQEAFNAAIEKKRSKEGSAERPKSHVEQTHILRQTSHGLPPTHKDRASRARNDKLQGRPKKHGAGGKYNWGGTLDCEGATGAQDPNDPNYDSESEVAEKVWLQESAPTNTAYSKQAVQVVLTEYLLTGNQVEAIASLQNALKSLESFYLVKKLVMLAMDYPDRQRELASQLLSGMYSTVVPGPDMERAFRVLLEAIPDLELDVPNASELLALFMARAVVDDILPPSFLKKSNPELSQSGVRALEKAACLLKAPHSAQRLHTCWGGSESSDSSYVQLADKIGRLLDEYRSSRDFKEAQICVSKLHAPLTMHELVKQAIIKAVSYSCPEPMLELLGHLYTSGQLSEEQLLKGFKRVHNNLDDLTLDVPNAKSQFDSLCQHAESHGWFSRSALSNSQDTAATNAAPARAWGSGLQSFKKAVRAATLEYFTSSDCSEVRKRLEELDQPGFHSLAVKQIVQLALEAQDREREMVARLLQELTPDVLSTDELSLGFKRLLASAEDLILDIPSAPHHLSIFLGRVIVDELLPPAYLTSALAALRNGSLGVDIIQATGNLLKQRHAYERFQTYWHPHSSLQDIRSQIDGLVKEFLESGDASEVSRCWRDLHVPFFSHQLVFAILLADFGTPAAHIKLFNLLGRLLDSGEISETQLDMGFDRVQQQLTDLKLDFPKAPEQFSKCKLEAEERHWLQPAVPAQEVHLPVV